MTAVQADDPSCARHEAAPVHPEGLLVLTRDETLLEAVRRAQVDRPCYHGASEGDLAAHLLTAQTGMVLLDATAVVAPEHLVEGLAAQFPELTIVVAAERPVQVALADPLRDGIVFRVVGRHVSAARLREVIEAAHARRVSAQSGHEAASSGAGSARRARSHDAAMLAAALLGALLLFVSCFVLQRPVPRTSPTLRHGAASMHRPGALP